MQRCAQPQHFHSSAGARGGQAEKLFLHSVRTDSTHGSTWRANRPIGPLPNTVEEHSDRAPKLQPDNAAGQVVWKPSRLSSQCPRRSFQDVLSSSGMKCTRATRSARDADKKSKNHTQRCGEKEQAFALNWAHEEENGPLCTKFAPRHDKTAPRDRIPAQGHVLWNAVGAAFTNARCVPSY